jgi:HEPN domain-containing protein
MLPEAKAKEVRNWFVKAKRDLTVAGINVAIDPPITDDALFHYQQAVEKALKGLLVLHDKPFNKTHIIGELAQDVLKLDGTLEPLLRQATELTASATMFRYHSLSEEAQPGDGARIPPSTEAGAGRPGSRRTIVPGSLAAPFGSAAGGPVWRPCHAGAVEADRSEAGRAGSGPGR